ncbi:MAG: hypothetical protein HYT31_01025 [Parcubacteria group bacterium]|nr:hypothetical protein [Parcubacteria group bacterium]
MLKSLIFWLGILGVLASWELALADPGRVLYWLLLCLASSSIVSVRFSDDTSPFRGIMADRIAVVLFVVGAFWWFLWLDFAYIKYAVPFLVWLGLMYASARLRSEQSQLVTVRLALFFGGTFFWSVTSFGLLSVIGWEVWETLSVFGVSFGVFSYTGVRTLQPPPGSVFSAWLVLLLLGLELFSVVAWLPFTEVTLALVLTVLVLFCYDFIKYYLFPERIRKMIIIKKLAIYAFFILIVLVSTPWV